MLEYSLIQRFLIMLMALQMSLTKRKRESLKLGQKLKFQLQHFPIHITQLNRILKKSKIILLKLLNNFKLKNNPPSQKTKFNCITRNIIIMNKICCKSSMKLRLKSLSLSRNKKQLIWLLQKQWHLNLPRKSRLIL